MAANRQRGFVMWRPTVLDKVEEEPLVRTVNLVARHRVSEPRGVDPDLMHSPGLRNHSHQRVASTASERHEVRLRRLPALDYALAHADQRVHRSRDRLIDMHRLAKLSAQDGVIHLANRPALNPALLPRCRLYVFRDHDDAAGFAIEPRRQVNALEVHILAAGADRARPWAVLRGMARNQARLVEDQQIGVLMKCPAL